jgi:transposase InsO family protein
VFAQIAPDQPSVVGIPVHRAQAEARMAIFSYIEGWYNPARRHSGIRYLSPIAYEMQMLQQTQTT